MSSSKGDLLILNDWIADVVFQLLGEEGLIKGFMVLSVSKILIKVMVVIAQVIFIFI